MTGDDGAFRAFERRGSSEPLLSRNYYDHLVDRVPTLIDVRSVGENPALRGS